MPHIAFLYRLRRLFGGNEPHLETIAAALSDGRLKQPAHPMSDQELSRAIREFQRLPPSESSLKKLAERLGGAEPG
ncbi:conserved protein of unknown function [Bradyrhizobium sp. ORS 285]|uniref:hypothetical protein n=1 Tax=Bradyrhizobium sp. ORS 285 TaxID=115808 RepID=UPI0002406251|nr:hypothetical protein [Bradyrhizobium sp. ORS 285]CCD88393.1 conserved hypothetical protein [Bradyrhizobium sp. ORS 285]SMX56858.1 conserved protein of unknown function [Bradyrhizobium sp. ORS 285]